MENVDNNSITTSGTPPIPQHGREPEPKPLAQYLAKYVKYELNSNADVLVSRQRLHKVLEQALDAYESTEQVKIRIERV